MTDIAVNYDPEKGVFQIYEATSQTLLVSPTLGEGFSNLNSFLLSQGKIKSSIVEDSEVTYHFDSHTFQEIIKSNLSLLKRVSDIPSEFKNSASKFSNTSSGDSRGFSRGSRNFQKKKFSGGSEFRKSYSKFKR